MLLLAWFIWAGSVSYRFGTRNRHAHVPVAVESPPYVGVLSPLELVRSFDDEMNHAPLLYFFVPFVFSVVQTAFCSGLTDYTASASNSLRLRAADAHSIFGFWRGVAPKASVTCCIKRSFVIPAAPVCKIRVARTVNSPCPLTS
jgi:hypothetical protein